MSLVRVRLENGRETNVGTAWAEINDLTVLDEPTHNGDGTPRRETRTKSRRVKPKTSVSAEAARKKNRGGAASAPTAEEATE
jgi:hypothetical protein